MAVGLGVVVLGSNRSAVSLGLGLGSVEARFWWAK